jgi:hypothetical protein
MQADRPQPEKLLRRSTQAKHDALERALSMAAVADGAGAIAIELSGLDDVDMSDVDVDSLVAGQSAPQLQQQPSLAGETESVAAGRVEVEDTPPVGVAAHNNSPAAVAAEDHPSQEGIAAEAGTAACECVAGGREPKETVTGAASAVVLPQEGAHNIHAAADSDTASTGQKPQEATAGVVAAAADKGKGLLQQQLCLLRAETEHVDSIDRFRVSGIKIEVLDPARKNIKTKTSKGTILTRVSDDCIKPGVAYVVADFGRAKGSADAYSREELIAWLETGELVLLGDKDTTMPGRGSGMAEAVPSGQGLSQSARGCLVGKHRDRLGREPSLQDVRLLFSA